MHSLRTRFLMMNRGLATINNAARLNKTRPVLSLNEFLQRKAVLNLWRDILRASTNVPKSPTRSEMLKFAREEFERHRHVTDADHIKYLLSNGKTQFDSMRRYVEENCG